MWRIVAWKGRRGPECYCCDKSENVKEQTRDSGLEVQCNGSREHACYAVGARLGLMDRSADSRQCCGPTGAIY